MTNQNLDPIDELIEWGRELLRKIDELIHPEKKRQLQRVPVPVHNPRPPMNEDK